MAVFSIKSTRKSVNLILRSKLIFYMILWRVWCIFMIWKRFCIVILRVPMFWLVINWRLNYVILGCRGKRRKDVRRVRIGLGLISGWRLKLLGMKKLISLRMFIVSESLSGSCWHRRYLMPVYLSNRSSD